MQLTGALNDGKAWIFVISESGIENITPKMRRFQYTQNCKFYLWKMDSKLLALVNFSMAIWIIVQNQPHFMSRFWEIASKWTFWKQNLKQYYRLIYDRIENPIFSVTRWMWINCRCSCGASRNRLFNIWMPATLFNPLDSGWVVWIWLACSCSHWRSLNPRIWPISHELQSFPIFFRFTKGKIPSLEGKLNIYQRRGSERSVSWSWWA